MVNASETKYNITGAETYPELFQDVNAFVGGSLGLSLIFIVWLISFFSLQNFRTVDTFKASTYVAWLTSMFMTLVGLVDPAIPLLLFLTVLAATGYSSRRRQ